jgi:catechol 2,3-dioxygenase-like lactoylglutathione lyase family enzyme
MITGMQHTGLSVSDLDRSLAFYRDVIGLRLLRIIEPEAGKDLGKVVGLPGCQARIAHLQAGDVMLELFEYQEPRGDPIPADRSQADNGYIHVGFASTDARADYKRFRALGVRCISEPVEFRAGVWIFYFYGPDGEVCELREA